MTKKDLKNGMYVETRNGNRYILIDDKFMREEGFNYIDTYNDDLTCPMADALDIVKVYDADTIIDFHNNENLIWTRKENDIRIGDIFEDNDGDRFIIYDIENHNYLSYHAYGINGNEIYPLWYHVNDIESSKRIGHDDNYLNIIKSIANAILDL